MSLPKVYNGTTYDIPQTLERGWDQTMTGLLADMCDNNVTLTGSQTLTNKTLTAPTMSAPTITGVLKIGAGSAATPSLAFSANTSTGIFQANTGELNITTAGTLAATFDANQKLALVGELEVADEITASNGLTISSGGADITGTVTLHTPLAIGSGGTGVSTIGTAGQTPQVNSAATGLEYAGPIYPGFKNVVIGGDFSVNPWQRGTTFASISSGYCADRFGYSSSGSGVVTITKGSGGPTGTVSQNNLTVTVTSADASIASSDFYEIYHHIEGYNAVRFGLGTAAATQMTLSFWVSASVTGTYGVGFRNNAANRSYVATYTVNVANTWELKTINLTGDTSGTWLYTTGIGLTLFWPLAAGSTYQTTAGSWQGGNYIATSAQANAVATNSNTFKLSDIQLELGSVATPFERLDAGTTWLRCQRYFQSTFGPGVTPGNNQGYNGTYYVLSPYSGEPSWNVTFQAQMRTAPTITFWNPANGTGNQWTIGSGSGSTGNARAVQFTTYGGRIDNGGVAPGNNTYNVHITSDAEL